jgi:hypothetical protein
MDLKDAIEFISEQAVEAKKVDRIEGGGRNKTRYFGKDNAIITVEHDPPARNHTVFDLDSLATNLTKENSSVWHSGNQVVAILDDRDESHRDDRVTWPIKVSAKYTALTSQAATPRAHADFVRWIVQNLRDEFDASAPGLLGTIRSLNFKSVDAADGSIQQGRESMGREIQNEITGASDLPETIIIKVKRWADMDYFAEIECLLVLDVQDRKLSLRPLADQLESAENKAQAWLHDLLTSGTDAAVYYGTP